MHSQGLSDGAAHGTRGLIDETHTAPSLTSHQEQDSMLPGESTIEAMQLGERMSGLTPLNLGRTQQGPQLHSASVVSRPRAGQRCVDQ